MAHSNAFPTTYLMVSYWLPLPRQPLYQTICHQQFCLVFDSGAPPIHWYPLFWHMLSLDSVAHSKSTSYKSMPNSLDGFRYGVIPHFILFVIKCAIKSLILGLNSSLLTSIPLMISDLTTSLPKSPFSVIFLTSMLLSLWFWGSLQKYSSGFTPNFYIDGFWSYYLSTATPFQLFCHQTVSLSF